LVEPHEEEILRRMYDSKIIGEKGYGRLQNIENTVRWSEIQAKYGVKKKFKSVMQHLASRGLLIPHKGGEAYALSQIGISYVRGRLLTSGGKGTT
jgi:hypothetical protein